MQENKRQKQIGGLINEELATIFQLLGLNIIDGGMVSISSVKVTPDLLEARVYLSIFNAKDNKAALKKIEERAWEIKKELAARVKHQLRRIPEVKYFLDDTLDHVFKMEELFKQIKKEEGDNPQGEVQTQTDKYLKPTLPGQLNLKTFQSSEFSFCLEIF
jgi:ribosome-binding factor A